MNPAEIREEPLQPSIEDIRKLSLVVATFTLLCLFLRLCRHDIQSLNSKRPFEPTAARAKQEFVTKAQKSLKTWYNANTHRPVDMNADVGSVKVLPASMANDIRNDDRLSFFRYFFTSAPNYSRFCCPGVKMLMEAQAFHGHVPRFNRFREGGSHAGIVANMIASDLTKYLNKLTEPLANEAVITIQGMLAEDAEWHIIPVKDAMLRAQVQASRTILEPILEEQRRLRARLQAKEKKVKETVDNAIEWFENAAKCRPYDPVGAQLILSVAATTSPEYRLWTWKARMSWPILRSKRG
ncbi:hypothetical protein AnigIFM50267_011841 [Aspergillus niger]|nr:hypothetical protein AnigIFM50267_011841 [Aspergillus niger]